MSTYKFNEYIINRDLNIVMDYWAMRLIEEGTSPQEVEEFAEAALRNVLPMAAGIPGAMMGSAAGPLGSMAGAIGGAQLGHLANKAVGGYFTKGLPPEVNVLHSQAKNAVFKLLNVLSTIQGKSPDAKSLLHQAQQLHSGIMQMEPAVKGTQSIMQKAADAEASNRGFFGRMRYNVGKMGRGTENWLDKHPKTSLAATAATGAGLAHLYGLLPPGSKDAAADTTTYKGSSHATSPEAEEFLAPAGDGGHLRQVAGHSPHTDLNAGDYTSHQHGNRGPIHHKTPAGHEYSRDIVGGYK